MKITIKRCKSKNKNTYEVNEEEYSAFNRDVPTAIKDLLNFSSLNMASQFDSPFLLAMSGGEVAKYLNRIVHLDQIDLGITNINSTLRKERQQLQAVNDLERGSLERSKAFQYLEKAEKTLNELESLDEELRSVKNDFETLSEILAGIENCEEVLGELPALSNTNKQVIKIEKGIDKILDFGTKTRNLYNLLRKLEDCEDSLEKQSLLLEKDQETFDKLMPNICPLCGRE